MRLLLDHCVDRRLAAHFRGHTIQTTFEMGWEQLQNGRLLAAAAAAGFDAVITTDRSIKHQQNLEVLPIAVIVLKAVTNKVSDLVTMMPLVEAALQTLPPRTLIEVEARRGHSGAES